MVGENSEGKISSYNAGALSAMRLHELMVEANKGFMEGDLGRHFTACDCLLREAKPKLGTREFAEADLKAVELYPLVSEWAANRMAASVLIDKAQLTASIRKYNELTFRLRMPLREFDVLVRTLLDKHGMMLPDDKDPARAIRGGM